MLNHPNFFTNKNNGDNKMKKLILPIISVILLFLVFPLPSFSMYATITMADTLIAESLPPDSNYNDTGIYVSTSGNDQTGTGTIDNPYRTITHALSVANAGDVITLRGGVYNESIRIQIPNITIRSKSDEWAVISSPINDENIGQCVRVDVDASGLKLQRLEITGGYYYGIKLETKWDWGGKDRSGVSNVTIDGCKIHDTGNDCVKITPNCDSVTIRRCEIYNSGMRYNGNAEGIDNVNGDRMLVQDCYIHNIATNGLYFKGGATLCVVERTRIENCGGGGIMVGFDTSPEFFDTTANPRYYESIYGIVRNCIISNTEYAGIGLYAAKNAKIYNNTLINTARTDHSPIYFGLTFQDWDTSAGRPPSVNPVIMNNLIVQDDTMPNNFVFIRYAYVEQLGGDLYSLAGMPIMDNNCYYKKNGNANFEDRRPTSLFNGNLSGWRSHISNEINSIEADPLITGNFHLSSTSPCIDEAQSTPYVTYDYDKQLRRGNFDIGADEFNQSTGVVNETGNKPNDYYLFQNYPNPFNPTTTIRFLVPRLLHVTLKVFDVLGREVATLVDGELNPGEHSVVFNAKDLPSGVYFYRLITTAFTQTKSMEVIK